MISRREFGGMVAGLPLAVRVKAQTLPARQTDAVRFGLQTFSFHDLPPAGDPQLLPTIVSNMLEIGVPRMRDYVGPRRAVCELHDRLVGAVATGARVSEGPRAGPPLAADGAAGPLPRGEEAVRRRRAHASISTTSTSTRRSPTQERDRTFEAARALGVAGISSSTVLTEATRLVPFVERHKMFVAMHNHNNLVDPDQFATPASFEKALAMSDYFKVTLDIGHFVAGNNDPVDFIRKHHARIVNIHIRDRKRNNGPSRPFGQGDTPIKEVLRLIRDNQYPIRCYLEYQYGSFRFSVEEVKRCLEYCRQALA